MTYKNAKLALTTTMADVYTAPVGGARVTMCQIANVDGSNDVDVTVVWSDASDSDVETELCFNATVAAKDALSVPAGGLVLEAGDKIRALASADGDAKLTLCVVEG